MTSLPESELPVIVLAAGQSARMRGRDKLLEDVAGEPLLRRQVRHACAATTGPVIVALPSPPHDRYKALEGCNFISIEVPDAATGMSASLKRGINALPRAAPAAMILPADLPDLDARDMVKVLGAVALESDAEVWRGATETGLPGHPLVIRACVFDAFQRLRGDQGGAEVLKALRDKTVLVSLPGDRARRDLDTPEDWAEWRAGRAS